MDPPELDFYEGYNLDKNGFFRREEGQNTNEDHKAYVMALWKKVVCHVPMKEARSSYYDWLKSVPGFFASIILKGINGLPARKQTTRKMCERNPLLMPIIRELMDCEGVESAFEHQDDPMEAVLNALPGSNFETQKNNIKNGIRPYHDGKKCSYIFIVEILARLTLEPFVGKWKEKENSDIIRPVPLRPAPHEKSNNSHALASDERKPPMAVAHANPYQHPNDNTAPATIQNYANKYKQFDENTAALQGDRQMGPMHNSPYQRLNENTTTERLPIEMQQLNSTYFPNRATHFTGAHPVITTNPHPHANIPTNDVNGTMPPTNHHMFMTQSLPNQFNNHTARPDQQPFVNRNTAETHHHNSHPLETSPRYFSSNTAHLLSASYNESHYHNTNKKTSFPQHHTTIPYHNVHTNAQNATTGNFANTDNNKSPTNNDVATQTHTDMTQHIDNNGKQIVNALIMYVALGNTLVEALDTWSGEKWNDLTSNVYDLINHIKQNLNQSDNHETETDGDGDGEKTEAHPTERKQTKRLTRKRNNTLEENSAQTQPPPKQQKQTFHKRSLKPRATESKDDEDTKSKHGQNKKA